MPDRESATSHLLPRRLRVRASASSASRCRSAVAELERERCQPAPWTMKIKSVETYKLILPPPRPKTPAWRPSYNKLVKRAHPINRYPEFPRGQGRIPGQSNKEIWVKITAEDGTFGLGTCRWGDVVDPLIKYHLAPLVVGKDAFAIEFINDVLWRATQRTGPTGLTTIARSAIDLALWDLKGKLLETPVYSLIGGPCRDSLNLYATSDDLDWTMELGFKAFKISNPVF